MRQLSLVENTPPGDVEQRLEDIAKGIETVQATAIIKIGERLAEARDLFRYDRREGGFGGWVEKRLGIGKDTAYRMISVFENLGESVAHERHFEELPARVLYALAAPSTPAEVRAEVEQMLIDGQRVTAADVKKLKEELASDQAKAAKEHARAARADAMAAKHNAAALKAEARLAEINAEQQAKAQSAEQESEPVDADAIAREVEQRVRREVQVEADQRVAQLAVEKRALRDQLEALQRRVDRLTSPEVEAVEDQTATNVVRLSVEEDDPDEFMSGVSPTTGEDAMHAINGSLAVLLNAQIAPPEFWRMSHRHPDMRISIRDKVLRGLTVLAQLAEGYDE